MAAWIGRFGGIAVQAALVVFGAISVLVFARDGFQVFLQDVFNWLIVLGESILGSIFEQPAIRLAIGKLLDGLQSWISGLGIHVDLILQSHWKHAFVLMSLAFSAYAHAFKDFVARPAASIFRYANALFSAFLGGLMAGTVHLAHPGVVAWPLAAFLMFRGFNSLWRCFFEAHGLKPRALAVIMALLWFSGVTLIANYALRLSNSEVLPGDSPSPGLMLIALTVAGVGVWATVFGFGAARSAVEGDERLKLQWLDNPGRKMGLRVLATLSVAAFVAGLGQAAWGIAREPSAADVVLQASPFRDCADCPEMVLIPAGAFTMGTTEAQKERLQAVGLWDPGLADEMPAHTVTVPAFALARTEVTLAQFQAFINATGYRPSGVCWGQQEGEPGFYGGVNWRSPGYEQGSDHPVVCVTWWDAQAYARWVTLITGETYRLPTEAEFEYATRAGTQTDYHWGDDPEVLCAYMNGADETMQRTLPNYTVAMCDDGALYTTPVASYRPNGLGLSDMTGNVWEWVQDCYGEYDPARTDSAAVVTEGCSFRIVRGGSWIDPPVSQRSAVRVAGPPSFRDFGVGFRLARTVSAP